MTNNFYIDNSVLRPLLAKNNEHLYNSLYDSLSELGMHMSECRIYFSWFSLLEVIGDGNLLEKTKVDLSQYMIVEPLNMITQDLLIKKISGAYNEALLHFSNHPELSSNALLKKIEIQLTYSSGNATKILVQDTLKRYQSLIKSSLDSLAVELAWDIICSFDFIFLEQEQEAKKENKRAIVRKIHEYLLRHFHHLRSEGYDYNSSRLTNKIIKELLTDPKYPNELAIDLNQLLEKNKDLGDADGIHFATFGMPDSSRFGIVLTGDDKLKTINKLKAQLSIMQYLAICENSKLALNPGIICIVDLKSFKIVDRIVVKNFLSTNPLPPYSFTKTNFPNDI